MANVTLTLDRRSVKKDGTSPVKFLISFYGQTVRISSGICVSPSNWVHESVIGTKKAKSLNQELYAQKMKIEECLRKLDMMGKLTRISVTELKRYISGDSDVLAPDNLLAPYFLKFGETHYKPKTRQVYKSALRKIEEYIGSNKLKRLCFEDVTKNWLVNFNMWMRKTCSVNTCSVHLRTIRAVFNNAIENEVTTNYPFKAFKIKSEKTRKRSLPVDELRELFDYKCEPQQQKYIDMFKLIFMLIGINTVDLYNLKEIRRDRIEYQREKTYRDYSIKVEPEAAVIIEKYKGTGKHLVSLCDNYVNAASFNKYLNKNLKLIGDISIGKRGKKERVVLHSDLTTYWARHSWATIAASLDIPKETIAAALGHGGNTVTDIYIDFDQNKVDDANRRVLDWVLYGKR